MKMNSMNIKYQLVPPRNHISNNVERAMQTLKTHFIAGLLIVDKYFYLHLWDRLLQQAKIILNLTRQSITLPHLPAYTHIFGEFYFNRTLLSPPGTLVFINNIPNNCTSWAPHGEVGWYIGPAIEHYRWHKTYIPKIIAERISDTVEFPQNNSTFQRYIP